MNVASSLAVAVAERVERTGGPRAGLVAWKALAGNSTDGEIRGKALLAALRCAVALREDGAIGELITLWGNVDRGVWDVSIAVLCKEMTRAGLLRRATELARAEAERHRTALSLYVHARCLDVAGDDAAAGAFRSVVDRAVKEGAKDIALAARVRRATLLARSWDTMSEALEEATQVDIAAAPPESKLALARVLLFSPSRFVRAGAIGVLDDLASSSDPETASFRAKALRLAATWADDVGAAMTPLESDRLIAMFGRERIAKVAPHAKEVLRACEQITRARDDAEVEARLEAAANAAFASPELAAQHTRAREILRGRYEPQREGERLPADETKRRAFRQQEILDVAVAIRDKAPARAARTLRLLAEAAEAGEHLPRELDAVAHLALERRAEPGDAELRDAAVRFFAARLSRASYGAPPRGYLALADTLATLDQEALSKKARRAAVTAKEPGAAESLGIALARQGWELARQGERARAIERLREAKRLLDGTPKT